MTKFVKNESLPTLKREKKVLNAFPVGKPQFFVLSSKVPDLEAFYYAAKNRAESAVYT